jgi:hypothetical protein
MILLQPNLTVVVYAVEIIPNAVIAAVCRSLMIVVECVVVKCVILIIAVYVMIFQKMTVYRVVIVHGAVVWN